MGRFSATPYAKALLETVAAEDADALEAVGAELRELAAAFSAVPEFGRAMVTPALSQERKRAILEAVLERAGVRDVLRRFLLVLQANYRLQHLAAVASAYEELVDRRLGRVRATIEVAVRPDEGTRSAIVGALESAFGSGVLAEFAVDESLLAGFRARVGSRVYDASALGQLERLRRAAAGRE